VGTRRIALVGDSLLRGMGAPFGSGFEPLLEQRLAAIDRPSGIERYELLNFGVAGYRITQLLEVALTEAPRFSPDVLVLALSDVSVFRAWGNHLACLVRDGIDPKYPFLEEVVERAGLCADDAFSTAEAKLAPFCEEVLRRVLETVRDRQRAEDRGFCVLLLPTVTDSTALEERFDAVRALLVELDIPTVDLLDTFAGEEDLDALRVSAQDHHPNEAGHRRLADRLERRLRANPSMWALWTGR
jgi:lysophospholipase L1-like esterase